MPAREIDPTAELGQTVHTKMDRRDLHLEVEDDSDGMIWSAGEAVWNGDGTKMAEWDGEEAVRKRWVGPMMQFLHLICRMKADVDLESLRNYILLTESLPNLKVRILTVLLKEPMSTSVRKGCM